MPDFGATADAQLVRRLVPAWVEVAETRVDESPAELFPAEAELVARAVPKRRNEFTAGRVCARRALARLGIAPEPLLAGPKREPLWPAGTVGSITHTDGYRAAVAARTADALSIGIDAEPNGPTPEGVLERVSLPAERAWVRAAAARVPGVHWDRLLFCAKEAVYKAWYPLTGTWLGFEDALVTLVDPGTGEPAPPNAATDREQPVSAAGAFSAALLVAGPRLADGRDITTFRGEYLVSAGLILTSVVVSTPHRLAAGETG